MTATVGSDQVEHVSFHFDPACPWTFRTAQWLADVAARRKLPVAYRAFELTDGAPLETMREQSRDRATASRQFLRAVERAHADGADEVIGRLNAAYGSLVHDGGEDPTVDLLHNVFAEQGGEAYLGALTDESMDEAVAASRREAQVHSGEDTGSPVLVLTTPDGPAGFFGPVIAPPPTADAADRLWDLIVLAASVPELYELKRRRTSSP